MDENKEAMQRDWEKQAGEEPLEVAMTFHFTEKQRRALKAVNGRFGELASAEEMVAWVGGVLSNAIMNVQQEANEALRRRLTTFYVDEEVSEEDAQQLAKYLAEVRGLLGRGVQIG